MYGDTSAFLINHNAPKWILNFADSFRRVRPWRLRLARHNYKAEYQPGTTHKAADGVCRPRRSDGEQEPIDGEVPCVVTESSLNGDAEQPKHCYVMLVFSGNTEVETWTDDRAPSTVVNADKEVVAAKTTLEEFCRPKTKTGFAVIVPSR